MTIRLGVAEDAAAVVALERGIATAPHWPEAAYAGAIQAGGLFVAELEGVIVGFAVGQVAAGQAELESVAVAIERRRAGVGRGLCLAVIDWARARGAGPVDLEVRASSVGARALYAELGFVEVGRRAAYYASPMDDAVLMRLEGGVGTAGTGL